MLAGLRPAFDKAGNIIGTDGRTFDFSRVLHDLEVFLDELRAAREQADRYILCQEFLNPLENTLTEQQVSLLQPENLHQVLHLHRKFLKRVTLSMLQN